MLPNPLRNGAAADDSVVSGLSDENQTVASKRSIWSQAASILRGELPIENQTIPEEPPSSSEELLGLSVPGGGATTNGGALTVDTLLQNNEENQAKEGGAAFSQHSRGFGQQ